MTTITSSRHARARTLSPHATARAGGLHPVGVFILLSGAFLPIMDFLCRPRPLGPAASSAPRRRRPRPALGSGPSRNTVDLPSCSTASAARRASAGADAPHAVPVGTLPPRTMRSQHQGLSIRGGPGCGSGCGSG